MKEDDQILLNRIRTPDGTVLTSYYRHDYRTYTDKNGQTYMVDGGAAYLRRNICAEPYTELTVYLTDDHEANREALYWGTFGKDGKQDYQNKLLSTLSDEHIEAILETQILPEYRVLLLKEEQKYRVLRGIKIKG